MKTWPVLGRQLAYEQRMFWRNPGAVFFTLGLPVLMLVIFISLNGTDTAGDGRSFGAYFVPGMLVFGLINSTYGYVATKLVTRRDNGLLKRVRATPLPLPVLLAATIANAIAVAVAITTLVLVAGRVLYDIALPARWGLAVAVVAIGSVAFAALGLALATVIPNADAADPIVFATILPLLFVSGVFDEVPSGSVLAQIAQVFPVQHLFQAALATTGGAPGADPYRHLLVVAAWGAAGAVIAARRFRWETPG
jgi:ABC-2 type transport system permease protein